MKRVAFLLCRYEGRGVSLYRFEVRFLLLYRPEAHGLRFIVLSPEAINAGDLLQESLESQILFSLQSRHYYFSIHSATYDAITLLRLYTIQPKGSFALYRIHLERRATRQRS
jgi:hypothetical protein